MKKIITRIIFIIFLISVLRFAIADDERIANYYDDGWGGVACEQIERKGRASEFLEGVKKGTYLVLLVTGPDGETVMLAPPSTEVCHFGIYPGYVGVGGCSGDSMDVTASTPSGASSSTTAFPDCLTGGGGAGGLGFATIAGGNLANPAGYSGDPIGGIITDPEWPGTYRTEYIADWVFHWPPDGAEPLDGIPSICNAFISPAPGTGAATGKSYEGPYVFFTLSDGTNYGSGEESSRCQYDALNVDWNRDDRWCTGPPGTSGVCGWGEITLIDPGVPDPPDHSDCCSAREMDENFDYTNEDCNKIVGAGLNLCYYGSNPKWEYSEITTANRPGQWLNSDVVSGEIIYEGCGDIAPLPPPDASFIEEGYEYLALDSHHGWIHCNESGFNNVEGDIIRQVTGRIFTDDGSEILRTHQFICIDKLAGEQYSIAECNTEEHGEELNWQKSPGETYVPGDPPTDMRRDGTRGGIVALGGQSVNLSDEQVYFCVNSSRWDTDLDSRENAGKDGRFCTNSKHPKLDYRGETTPNADNGELKTGWSGTVKWTGSRCCGETDDWGNAYPNMDFNVGGEYYNDYDRDTTRYYPEDLPSPDSGGACFNNRYQKNNTFLKIAKADGTTKELREVMIWHGTFQGCALNYNRALVDKENDDENNGKYQEDVECGEPNTGTDLQKPYSPSWTTEDPADYGYDSHKTFEGRPTNGFLQFLYDHPNPGGGGISEGNLIHDNEYCNIKYGPNGRAWFCSYTEVWKDEDNSLEEPRDHLSFIPWVDDTVQQAECCKRTQCWDGEECVDSVVGGTVEPYKPMNDREDGFICKDGKWEWAYKKFNWDGSDSGYCIENTQCYIGGGNFEDAMGPLKYKIDEITDIGTPECINDGEFYLDHMCENGTWSSRTKYVALTMYNLLEGSDFTLYCDRFNKVLNRVDYSVAEGEPTIEEKYFLADGSAELSRCFSYEGNIVPCANRVCVAVKNPNDPTVENREIIIGTSINHKLDRTTTDGAELLINDFGRALGGELRSTACIGAEGGDSEDLILCDATAGIYFNGKRSIVIFSRTIGAEPPADGYAETLKNLFMNFIKTLISEIAPLGGGGGDAFDYTIMNKLAADLWAEIGMPPADMIPDFECDECKDSRAQICGEWPNPRPIFDLNTLYMAQVGTKKMFGMAEFEKYRYDVEQRIYTGIMFENFPDVDVCALITRSKMTYVECKKKGDDYFIKLATSSFSDAEFLSLVDIAYPDKRSQWVFLLPSTRLQNE